MRKLDETGFGRWKDFAGSQLNCYQMLSLQEPDLLCALLLEQSAHCFLHCNPVMARKYAFNMILAGHRFSKSAQVSMII